MHKVSNFRVQWISSEPDDDSICPMTFVIRRGVDDRRWWVRFWRCHVRTITEHYTGQPGKGDDGWIHYPLGQPITVNAGDGMVFRIGPPELEAP